MITLKEGDKAPDFELEDGEGNKAKLSDFKGKKITGMGLGLIGKGYINPE